MTVRASNGPAPSTRSAKVGDVVQFGAKVENSGAAEERVSLVVEDLKEGALGKPVPYEFVFSPAEVALRPKSRERIAFAWTAGLPEGKPAFTFRGKIILRRADGSPAGSAPLDLYVSE